MYWLLSLVFWFFMFNFYYFLGDVLLDFFGYEKNAGKRLIIGFVFTFVFCFVVVFPCQILHLSWSIYFLAQSILFLIVIISLVIIRHDFIIEKYTYVIYHFKSVCKLCIKENWILIIFVILFTAFAISNQLPYYFMNYDDGFYLGKMVNSIGTPALENENYFNGSLLKNPTIGLDRILNTYEVSYAYFSSLFHIRVTFFTRLTMSFHNYIMFCVVYKEAAKLLIRKELSQYAIVPFFFFLISQGYLMYGLTNIHIRSYDLWQFQTAMFYGGSVVRSLSLPLLMIFSWPLLKKMEWKKIICMDFIILCLFSFSTVALPIVTLFIVIILGTKLIDLLYIAFKEKNRKQLIIVVISFILYIMFLFGTKGLDYFQFGDLKDKFTSAIIEVDKWIIAYYSQDILYLYGFVPCIISIFFYKKNRYKLYFPLFILLLYLLIRSMYFKELVYYSSMNVFFVVLRVYSSMQYMILFIFGICLVQVVQCFKKYYNIICGIYGLATVTAILLIIGLNMNSIKQQDFLGSGMTKKGYDFSRVLDFNTSMAPDITVRVGNYFDSLPYGNYRLYISNVVPYDNVKIPDTAFNVVSNRIQIHSRGGFGNLKIHNEILLNDFCDGKKDVSFYRIQSLFQKYKIDYILVTNIESKQELSKAGYDMVLSNKGYDDNTYFLFELNK